MTDEQTDVTQRQPRSCMIIKQEMNVALVDNSRLFLR